MSDVNKYDNMICIVIQGETRVLVMTYLIQ